MENMHINKCGTAISTISRRYSNSSMVVRNCTFDGNTVSILIQNSSLDVSFIKSFIKGGSHAFSIHHSTAGLIVEDGFVGSSAKGFSISNSVVNVIIRRTVMERNSEGVFANSSTILSLNVENSTFTDHIDQTIKTVRVQSLNINIIHTLFHRNRRLIFHDQCKDKVWVHMSNCTITSTQDSALKFNFHNRLKLIQVEFSKNTFMKNSGKVFEIIENFRAIPAEYFITVRYNKFIDNDLPVGNGILELGAPRSLDIRANVFQNNTCTFVCKFNFVNVPHEAIIRFVHNTVENNNGISRSFPDTRYEVPTFAIGIFGCPVSDFLVQYNIFNNQQIDKEVFTGIGYCCTTYNACQVDARYNWWSTSNTIEIQKKIYDFQNWNNRPRVQFRPFSTSRDFFHFKNTKTMSNTNMLGGYVDYSMRLTSENSPYVVITDLTISRNSNITIQPGVTLLFKPRVGLLVLGNIFAVGTSKKPIRFCSLHTKCKASKNSTPKFGNLRLFRAYEGYLEIQVKNSWNFVCWRGFDLFSAKVACRQLGLEDAQGFSRETGYRGVKKSFLQKGFKCSGNESSLSKCMSVYVYCDRKDDPVNLVCKPGNKWGNIRVVSSLQDGQRKIAGEESSILRNVHIDDSGVLHAHKVPSVQIINRPLTIKHTKISNNYGDGIESVLPRSMTVFENVSASGITLLENKGSVVLQELHISNSVYGGLVIASLAGINLDHSFYGFYSMCDPFLEIFVEDVHYLYISPRSELNHEYRTVCSKQVSSPENTTISFRIRAIGSSIYGRVYDGSTVLSRPIWYFGTWATAGSTYPFHTTSNSMFLQVYPYHSAFKELLAEIMIVREKGNVINIYILCCVI